jgi:PTS system nitrogen regulatory IIA component
MRLTLREAATALNCTEKTVLRWIAQAGLPTVRVGGLYHFNRAELMEWAIHHGIGSTALSCELEPEPDNDCANISALAAALRMGGVLTDVPGQTLAEILTAAVARLLPGGPEAERQLVLDMLLAREETGVTAVGGGVLVPHVRAPLVMGDLPRILLVYPKEPLPLAAVPTPDKAPIEAVFVLVSPTVRAHLTLLALLAAALRDADFRAAVLCHAPEPALRMSAAAAERMHESARKRRGKESS